jgi:BirA family biotin operon repressor/biotin-[acetyl-CoA-carboxylase] ligase
VIGADLARAEEAIARRACALGAPLVVLAETASTNDEAKRAARAGAPHGATWIAESQTAGRGRQGRTWVARPGECLLFSVLARVSCAPARLPTLAIAAGLAVRDAIARAAPRARVGVKWPNDVVVAEDGRKLAGILVETTMSGARADAVIVGVGINVHTRDFPADIADRAASVAQIADDVPDRAELLASVVADLARDLDRVVAHGVAPLALRLKGADVLRGSRVRTDGDEGVAEGIDDDGRLLVRRDDGVLARWSSGEAHLIARSTTTIRR